MIFIPDSKSTTSCALSDVHSVRNGVSQTLFLNSLNFSKICSMFSSVKIGAKNEILIFFAHAIFRKWLKELPRIFQNFHFFAQISHFESWNFFERLRKTWAKNTKISFFGSVFNAHKDGQKIFPKFEFFGFLEIKSETNQYEN